MQLLLVYASCCLGKAGLGSGNVAPLLHNGLLDLPGVLPGPGAHLLGDVDTLLSGLEEGDKLCDMLALALRLQVAGLLRNLPDLCIGSIVLCNFFVIAYLLNNSG